MTKKMIQRFRQAGASIAVCVVALVFMLAVSACAGVAGNTTGNTTLSGSLVSVDAQHHSVSLNFNGQTFTINGLTDQEIAQLQAALQSHNLNFSFNVTKNSDGSYNISTGPNSVTEENNNETPNANEPQGQVEPGKI